MTRGQGTNVGEWPRQNCGRKTGTNCHRPLGLGSDSGTPPPMVSFMSVVGCWTFTLLSTLQTSAFPALPSLSVQISPFQSPLCKHWPSASLSATDRAGTWKEEKGRRKERDLLLQPLIWRKWALTRPDLTFPFLHVCSSLSSRSHLLYLQMQWLHLCSSEMVGIWKRVLLSNDCHRAPGEDVSGLSRVGLCLWSLPKTASWALLL